MTSAAEMVAALETELAAERERRKAIEDGSLLARAQEENERLNRLLRETVLERDRIEGEYERSVEERARLMTDAREIARREQGTAPAKPVLKPLWSGNGCDLEVEVGEDTYEPDYRPALDQCDGPVVVLPDWFAAERAELKKELARVHGDVFELKASARAFFGIEVAGPVFIESMQGGADGGKITFVQEIAGEPDMTTMLTPWVRPGHPSRRNTWEFMFQQLDLSAVATSADTLTFKSDKGYRLVQIPGQSKVIVLEWPSK